MKNNRKRTVRILTALCLVIGILMLPGCGKEAKNVRNCSVIHEPEFGGVYITRTIEEFNKLGFEYGDSVDVEFSNGYKLTDLPYYNGYYTLPGEPLLIAYPGYDYIKAAINNGSDLWTVAGLKDSDTASIRLNTKGKYKDIQDARDIHYKDERSEYPSDEVFANFRSIKAGALKPDTLYRSASPCDNQHNRAHYVDDLMGKAGIGFILNLSDNEQKIEGYMSAPGFDSPNFTKLYKAKKVEAIALNMNYGSEEFKEKIVKGLTELAKNEGPYLIHCTEGKDRTGFVCMLLEAFAGAGYDEIVQDYMITYYNYYGITKEGDKERYDVIVENVLLPMIESMAGNADVNVETADLSVCAENFLKDAGMTQSAITQLRSRIID